MGCLIAEIVCLILGIVALCTGKIQLSGKKVVRGAPARWIGAVLILPLPVSFIVGVCLGIVLAARGRPVDRQNIQLPATIIEITVFVLCLGTALLIGALSKKGAVSDSRRRRRVDEEEDYDDELPRSSRRRVKDKDEYENEVSEREPSPKLKESPPEPPAPLPDKITCPACKKTLAVPAQAWGKSIRCPLCQGVFVAQPPPKIVRISCSNCAKELKVPETALGNSVKCPLCQAVIVAQAKPEIANGVQASAPSQAPVAAKAEEPRRRSQEPELSSAERRRRPDRARSSGSALPWILAAVIGGVVLLGGVIAVVLGISWSAARKEAEFQANEARQRVEQKPVLPPWAEQGKGGAFEEKKAGPPRPPFGDAVDQTITLKQGSFQTQSQLDDTDPLDRNSQSPAKLFLIRLQTKRAYFLEMKSQGGLNPHVRLEDLAGAVLAAGEESFNGTSRLLLLAPKTETYRVVASTRIGAGGPFTLSVREVQDGDSLPPMKLPQQVVPRQSIQQAKKIEPFLAAAIAPDSRSAWVAFPGGKLQHFSCPDFEVKGTYKLPRRCYQLAMDGRGILYAVVEINALRTPALPWWDLGPADLHLFDTGKLPQEGGSLTPSKVIPLRGLVQHLCVSPDDAWLYFLDSIKRTVGRIDLKEGNLDASNGQIAVGANALCLTPNGKALYLCSNANVVQQLDPVTLKVVKTIQIDKGQPTGIQATDSGNVFLNSGEGQWTNVYLINANRDDQGARVNVIPWAGVYHTHSIRLAPDQKRLYAACFSLSPSNITSFYISDRPGLFKGQQSGAIGLDGVNARGGMEVSRDGSFMFCDRGLILLLGR